MFCPNCGKECTDVAKFCPNCGTTINAQPKPVVIPVAEPVPVSAPAPAPAPVAVPAPAPAPVAAPAPVVTPVEVQAPVAPPAPKTVTITPATTAQKKAAVLLAVLALFALFIGISHTFCMVELPVSVSVDMQMPSPFAASSDGYSSYFGGTTTQMLEIDGTVTVFDSTLGLLSEASDLAGQATGGVIDITVGTGYAALIIAGLINLTIAAFGALYYISIRTGKCNIFGFLKGKSPAMWIGIAGAAAAIIEILLMMTTGLSEEMNGMSASLSIGTHWSTWICLIIYGGVAAYELLRFDKSEE